MKILQVSPRYYSSVGGVEYTVKRLVEGMKNRGHQVAVVCGDPSAKHAETSEIDGVEVLRVPTYAPGDAFHIPKNRSAVERFIGNDVDVVHTHSAHAVISILPMAFKKSMKPRWKLVYTMHFSTSGYTFLRRTLWKLYWRRRINSGLKYADAIHATSLLESNLVKEQFDNAEGKLTIIPLGMDEEVFRYHWKGRNSDYVLYSGRLEKYKRVDLAVKSVELVRRQGYNVGFVIVGHGSESDYFRKRAEKNTWITCTQSRPRDEYLELLSNARAVINLSSAENFNLFLAEACTIGVPIVATPEAAAFCPEFANVTRLETDEVGSVVARALSQPDTCIFPKQSSLMPWDDVIGMFEGLYSRVLAS
jgi:glycosyltransferase involved in cell wall biosynthesis